MEVKKQSKVKLFFKGLVAFLILVLIIGSIIGGGFWFLWSQLNFGLSMFQFFLKLTALTVGFVFYSVAFWLIGITIFKKLFKRELKGLK